MKKSTLIKMYKEYHIPCDQLVSNPQTLTKFTSEYKKRTGEEAEPAQMGREMLNLRRRGEAKGGLPRLMRKYHGRNLGDD